MFCLDWQQGCFFKMTSSNRKLMAITNLTARADPQGVERYVAGLSIERPSVCTRQNTEANYECRREQKVHEMQTPRTNQEPQSRQITRYNLFKSVAEIPHKFPSIKRDEVQPDFRTISQARDFLEESGYRITTERLDDKSYFLLFTPRDTAA